MACLLLLSLLVVKIIDEHLTEAGVAIVLNFLSHDRGDGGELLGYESASAVALSAGQALLVHLRPIALDARDLFKVDGVLILRRGDQKVTCDISLLHLHFHLTGLVLHLGNDVVTTHVTDLNVRLAGVVSHLYAGVDHDIIRLDAGSVASGVELLDLLASSANRD